MKKFKGITGRWLRNTFVITALLFLIIIVAFSAFMKIYYYQTVVTTLKAHSGEMTTSFFNMYIGGTREQFESGANAFVEGFGDKDTMEVWVLDSEGKPIISSGGFSVNAAAEMPDYDYAFSSSERQGLWYGKNEYGEKVMAMSVMLPRSGNSENGAVRYIISLEEVDKQIFIVSMLVTLIYLLIISVIGISGIYFLRSILRPVTDANKTAQKIASGDLNTEIVIPGYDDEISDLCRNLNNMAKEIYKTDKMRNDFVSTVSHELRTPLTSIKGWGETLLQLGESDPILMKRGIEVIISEAGRLTEMVEELLDFSNMQGGRLNLHKEKMDVLAELDEVIFAFKERSARDGIEFICNVPTECASMEGDQRRIKQIFFNILDNAFKYTELGGQVVVVAEIKGDFVEIVVSDNGCGIASEDLPKIKEKFFKSNISVRGTGIGLAVADEIVKLHGGELNINSVLGEGTSVEIRLPIDPVVAD